MFPALLILCSAAAACAEDPSAYTVFRAVAPIVIDGRVEESAWTETPAVGAFQFAWWTEGKKEQTTAKLLWDDEYLYALFVCEDAHIWAEHLERDGAVYRDDCVEVFLAPNRDQPQAYFNIEMNVAGAFLDQWHPDGPGAQVPGEWNGDGIRIATSISGTLNDDSDVDDHWVLEAAIPLQNFSEAGQRTPPGAGDSWRLNLNRCGGKTNPQYSQWRPSQTPKAAFHVPEDFGVVTFSSDSMGGDTAVESIPYGTVKSRSASD